MVYSIYIDSPIGILKITGTANGIREVRKVENKVIDHPDTPDLLYQCASQLREYFAGERKEFKLPLDWADATEFNKMVWGELVKIPYGHTTSYSAIAEKLNNPKAVRAVGLANRNNPIAVIVPCHRVIAKNGDLQGYFYGLDIKRQLLQIENPMSYAPQGTLF